MSADNWTIMTDEFSNLYQKLASQYRLSLSLSPSDALRKKAANMQEMLDSEVISSAILKASFEEDIEFLNEMATMIEKIFAGD